MYRTQWRDVILIIVIAFLWALAHIVIGGVP
jgi:hypothetical protein